MVRSNAMAGEYTITFSAVPYFNTPAPQTRTLTASSKITFNGNYTFADVNNNQMPDSLEQEQFGEISATRTAITDTDGDGFTDRAEFVAGTFPTDPSSKLEVASVQVLGNNRVTVTWPATDGKSYQLLGSTDGRTWQLFTAPTRAIGSQVSHTLTVPGTGNYCYFKIEVIP